MTNPIISKLSLLCLKELVENETDPSWNANWDSRVRDNCQESGDTDEDGDALISGEEVREELIWFLSQINPTQLS